MMDTLRLPATMESLDKWQSFVLERIKAFGVPQEMLFRIELVLEELLVNVIHYAYPQGKGDIEVGCGLDRERKFHLLVQDWGCSFNPLAQEDPDLDADLCHRSIGGLGIYLVRQMAEGLSYRRLDDSNVLTFFFRL